MNVKIFALCLICGIAVGLPEGPTALLRRKFGIVFTVVSDLCFAFIAVFCHAVIMYLYCNGQAFFYAAAAQAAGFIAARTAAAKLACGIYLKLRRKKQKRA